MGNNPSVSILILNYNGKNLLSRCLSSVLSTLYDGQLEIVVVDNASSDSSIEYLQKHFPKITVIQNQENVGFSRAYNNSIAKISSEIVVFLNNDVVVEPDWLLQLLRLYQEKKNIGAVSATLLIPDSKPYQVQNAGITLFSNGYGRDRGAVVSVNGNQSYEELSPYYLQDRKVAALSGGAFMIARSLFQKLGGFDERFFMYYEDVDLSLRMRAAGYELWVSGSSYVWHHHAQTSQENSPFFLYHTERGHLIFTCKHATVSAIVSAWIEHCGLLLIALVRCVSSFLRPDSVQRRRWILSSLARCTVLVSVLFLIPLLLLERVQKEHLPWQNAFQPEYKEV